MTRRTIYLVVGVLTLTSTLASTMGGVMAASAPPAQEKQPPVFGTGVALVALPVYVTDKSGKAVLGLKAEDFIVEDGGKATPIVAFQAINADDPVETAADGEAAQLPALPMEVQAAAPRQFVILIDRVFSPPGGLFFGRKAAAEFLRKSLAPGDLVAVAAWGSNGLRVLTNFTTNHAAAAQAIDGQGAAGGMRADPLGLSGGLGIMGSSGNSGTNELPSGGIPVGDFGAAADAEFAAQDALMAQADARSYRNVATAFIADLSTLVKMLAPLRGRKQIVLMSSGFAEWAWSPDAPEGAPVLDRMKRVFKEAGEADVVVHAVTLDGIQAAGGVGEIRTRAIDGTGPPDFFKAGNARGTLNQGSGRSTLTAFAENTGGRFIMPTGDFKVALGEVDRISRHSYVVAFETDPTGQNDKPRNVKVRVRREGVTVSSRPSYSLAAPRPKTGDAGALRAEAAEAINKGLSGGALHVEVTALPYRDRMGNASVNAVLSIDGPALAEAAKGAHLPLQVYGYAMRGGEVLDSIALGTSLDLSKYGPAIQKTGIQILTAFPVAQGNVDLRFFVRTGANRVTGSIQRKVAVPAFADGQTVVSAPLSIESPTGRAVVPFQPQSRPAIPIPYYFKNQRFIPGASLTLSPGNATDVAVFVWRGQSGTTNAFSVTGELVRAGEPALPVRLEGETRVAHEADGFDRYIVKIISPDVAAGAYSLRLNFRDPSTGRSTVSETGVVIAK